MKRYDGFKVASDLDLERFQTDLVLDKEYLFNNETVVLRRIIAQPTISIKRGLLGDKIETNVQLSVVVERPDTGQGIIRGSISAIDINEFLDGLNTVKRLDNLVEGYTA